ncbi:MAG: hypothetical protein ACLTXC_01640 [Turicibacter sp.]
MVRDRQGKEITAEVFFQKYVRDQEMLKELEYQLARLDDDVIHTSYFRQDKVQTTIQNRLDERVYNREGMRVRLENEIQWTKFEIEHAELLMRQIGDKDRYRISYLKRRYLEKHSVSKIARDYGVSDSKVRRVMKETEELLCYLAK